MLRKEKRNYFRKYQKNCGTDNVNVTLWVFFRFVGMVGLGVVGFFLFGRVSPLPTLKGCVFVQ